MARNEHKKVLRQLSEAYQNVQEGLFNYRVQEDDGSWPIDEREAERRKNPDYGEPEEDGGYMGEDEDEDNEEPKRGISGYEHRPDALVSASKERVRLTLDSPGTASVHLPKGDPNIQKYLDKGYKIVKDYKKATQSEDAEETQPGDYGSIEDLFTQKVWYIGDRGDTFEVADFEEFKPYILNWDTLLEIMDEENTEGFSERWEEVKFGRSEDNEYDQERKDNIDYAKSKRYESEDGEGWGNILRGAAISSILGKGAVTGGLAGAAYDALKGKPKKKKEDKEDKGFTKGGW